MLLLLPFMLSRVIHICKNTNSFETSWLKTIKKPNLYILSYKNFSWKKKENLKKMVKWKSNFVQIETLLRKTSKNRLAYFGADLREYTIFECYRAPKFKLDEFLNLIFKKFINSGGCQNIGTFKINNSTTYIWDLKYDCEDIM